MPFSFHSAHEFLGNPATNKHSLAESDDSMADSESQHQCMLAHSYSHSIYSDDTPYPAAKKLKVAATDDTDLSMDTDTPMSTSGAQEEEEED